MVSIISLWKFISTRQKRVKKPFLKCTANATSYMTMSIWRYALFIWISLAKKKTFSETTWRGNPHLQFYCSHLLSLATCFFFSLLHKKASKCGRILWPVTPPVNTKTDIFTVISWSLSIWVWRKHCGNNSKGLKGLVLFLFGLHNVIFCLQWYYLMMIMAEVIPSVKQIFARH